MEVKLAQPGTFIVAVSGGVDSMVLLDLLSKSRRPDQQIIVAHLDHGIRSDSALDRLLVSSVAQNQGHQFTYGEAKLGKAASEALARDARYTFLEQVKAAHKARAIITAHHQDDVIETAIINLIRGCGRKGLSSLTSHPSLIRPLLNYPKSEIISYANRNQIKWREDQTNQDMSYLRNYIRHNVIPKLDNSARHQLLSFISQQTAINREIDKLLGNLIKRRSQSGNLEREWFNGWSHTEAKEILAGWLRLSGVTNFDRNMLELLVVAAKVGGSHHNYPVVSRQRLTISEDYLALEPIER